VEPAPGREHQGDRDEMRRAAELYPTLHSDDGDVIEAAGEAERRRLIYEDVLSVLREEADELGSHHTMDWLYEQAPWFAAELVEYQNDPRFNPEEKELKLMDASDALEEKFRARLNDSVRPSVTDLRGVLDYLCGEAGVEPDYVDGELVYTRLEGLLEKLATVAKHELGKAVTKAQEAEKKILSKRRARILPNDNELQKISRYEAHLSRELYKALHELEALQTRRAGGAAPLARVDVQGLPEG
jgi:hypothetical protein